MPYVPPENYYRLERLSWSGFKTYKRCGLAYKKSYVDKEPVARNAYNAVGGKTIQAVFERFYNDEIWRRGKEVRAILDDLLPKEYRRVLFDEEVDWKAPESKLTREELLDSLRPVVGTTLQVIKDHKLIGKFAKAEVKLQAWFDKVLVHGIADFVIRRDNSHIILDGKLTRHRKKYLDADQLVFYVMLFYLQHQVVVDQVGWIYYTYGELEWVPVTIEDVKRLHADIKVAIEGIRKNRFDADPSEDACRFCDFAKTCSFGVGQNQTINIEKKKASAAKQQKKYEQSGSPLAKEVDGVEEIGF